tara:strand:+ start:722 stop:1462 length:741 start_codon:yes stop_codon:yes gene_type:complete
MEKIYIKGRPDGLGNRMEQLINLEYFSSIHNLKFVYYWNNIGAQQRDNFKIDFNSKNIEIKYFNHQKNTITFENSIYKIRDKINVNKEKILKCASNIQPDFNINIPENIITVHLRGTDRISAGNHPHFMKSQKEYEYYIDCAFKKVCEIKPSFIFVCGDNKVEVDKFKNRIKNNTDIDIFELNNEENIQKPILDFFAITKTKMVIMATKFSSFSACAAMIGNIPILSKNHDQKNIVSRYPNYWVKF